MILIEQPWFGVDDRRQRRAEDTNLGFFYHDQMMPFAHRAGDHSDTDSNLQYLGFMVSTACDILHPP
jgi:hypothetical protein